MERVYRDTSRRNLTDSVVILLVMITVVFHESNFTNGIHIKQDVVFTIREYDEND